MKLTIIHIQRRVKKASKDMMDPKESLVSQVRLGHQDHLDKLEVLEMLAVRDSRAASDCQERLGK